MRTRLSSRLAAALCLLLLAACDPKKEDKPTAKADEKSESKKDADKADDKKVEAKADEKKADDAKADAKLDEPKADDAKADDPGASADGGATEKEAGPVLADGELSLDHEKVGELHTGMKGEDVEKLLGAPKEKGPIEEEAATGDLSGAWKYPDQGIELWMGHDDLKGKNPRILGLTVTDKCTMPLPWGLAIGSTRAEVEKVYGGNFDKDATTPETFIAGSVYGGSFYSFEDGKVVGLFIGAGAE